MSTRKKTQPWSRKTILLVLPLVGMLSAASISGSTASAAAVLIDDFSTPTPVTPADVYIINLLNSNPTVLTYTGAGILNNAPTVPIGQRELTVEVVTSPVGFVSATGSIGEGNYTFGSVDAAVTATLVYSAPGGGPLGSVDLTGGGTNTGFMFHFASLDSAAAPALDVGLLAVGPSGAVTAAASFDKTLFPANFFVPFSAFVPIIGSFAFTAVDNVAFAFNTLAVPDADFILTSINATAAPEPSTLLVCTLGGLALVAFRRWRASGA